MGYYFLTLLKRALNFFSFGVNMPKTQKFIDFGDEVCQQLDITYLIRKQMLLAAAVEKLIGKKELDALSLKEKPTVKEAKQMRKMHFSKEMLKRQSLKLK